MKLIADGLRQYFSLKESECKEYDLETGPAYMKRLIDSLSKPKDIELPNISQRSESWIVPESTEENEFGISVGLPLLEAIPEGLLICLRVESGRYNTLSETAKKWLLCTGNTFLPHKFWVKY